MVKKSIRIAVQVLLTSANMLCVIFLCIIPCLFLVISLDSETNISGMPIQAIAHILTWLLRQSGQVVVPGGPEFAGVYAGFIIATVLLMIITKMIMDAFGKDFPGKNYGELLDKLNDMRRKEQEIAAHDLLYFLEFRAKKLEELKALDKIEAENAAQPNR
jgi:hypothetical protein